MISPPRTSLAMNSSSTPSTTALTDANLAPVLDEMARAAVDAWVVFDLRGSSHVLPRLLGGKQHLTRRVFWILRREAKHPHVVCHAIDTECFKKLGVPHTTYGGWADLPGVLSAALAGCRRVAMEYSPGGALPAASTVDAGTLDLVRALGLEVASSADLVQLWAARWSERGLAAHKTASTLTSTIIRDAFAFIASTIKREGQCQERAAQMFITDRFRAHNLSWADDPIVAVNANSASPHYAPDLNRSSPIKPGDWVLIDLWCRLETHEGVTLGDEAIYSDITWTGFVGPRVPHEHRHVFDAVRAARDASLAAVQAAWRSQSPVEGWQLDDAARGTLHHAGLGGHIKHRTGHSLSPGPLVHGLGMNLDNLESHDTRRVLPGTGFTIEPGAYGVVDAQGRNFGVRNEINVYVDPAQGPIVTSCVQDAPELIV